MKIPFNKPCLWGDEVEYVKEAVRNQHLSGNGPFTQKCHAFFEEEMGFQRVFLTPSCTHALEMAALLCEFQPGDEVIIPSYTFVGTANAFVRAGAKVVFADSLPDHPNVDVASIEAAISPRTQAVVVVHYAGMACDMDALLELREKFGFLLIEDAAHAIGAKYKNRQLGGMGDLGAFSFHETKNLSCGQGGLLIVNRPEFERKAEQIWYNGTNRGDFRRGTADTYTWHTLGSCFTLSDMNAAYLYGQLVHMDEILYHRKSLRDHYLRKLEALGNEAGFSLPLATADQQHNSHILFITAPDKETRDRWIKGMQAAGILAVFHYLPLHKSPYYRSSHADASLPQAEKFAACLIRFPLYHQLSLQEVDYICEVFQGLL